MEPCLRDQTLVGGGVEGLRAEGLQSLWLQLLSALDGQRTLFKKKSFLKYLGGREMPARGRQRENDRRCIPLEPRLCRQSELCAHKLAPSLQGKAEQLEVQS